MLSREIHYEIIDQLSRCAWYDNFVYLVEAFCCKRACPPHRHEGLLVIQPNLAGVAQRRRARVDIFRHGRDLRRVKCWIAELRCPEASANEGSSPVGPMMA